MLISCDSCDTTFDLDESLLKPSGSKVRCSNCRSIFVVHPPTPSVEIVDDGIQENAGTESDDADDLGFDLGMEIDADLETEEEKVEPESDAAPELEIGGVDEPEIVDSEDMTTDSPVSGMDDEDEIGESEGLDLEDLGLILTDTESGNGTEDTDAFDFGDLELELDTSEGAASDEPDPETEGFMEMDLTEDKTVADAEDPSDTEETELDLDDLELELDMTPEAEATEEAVSDEPALETAGVEDLDLFGDETASEAEDSLDGEEAELDLDDLELELDMTPEAEATEEAVSDEPALEIEGVEDIDLFGDETASEAEDSLDGEETELDFGDLELELDVTEEPDTAEELVLPGPDLDVGGLDESEPTDTEPGAEDAAIDDFDIPEPDDMLEIADPSEPEEETAEADSGDVESIEADIPDGSDMDYDMSGMDLLEVDEIKRAEDISEETAPSDPSEAASDVAIGADDPEAPELEPFSMGSDGEETAAAVGVPSVAGSKRKMRSWMIIPLVAALLVAGGYAALNFSDLRIPLLSGMFEEEIADPHGNLQLSISDVTHKFSDNPSTGKLFVVNGKVRNDYPEPRGFIRVKGKLYSKGRILAKTEVVFSGNMLSDLDLANLDLNAIQQRLQNRIGDNRLNMRIEAGKQIPFMIVFSGLPESLEEFNIEIVGSLKL